MKKYIIIIVLCLIVCGCGSKKKAKENVSNSEIGTRDLEYKLVVSCGDKVKESTLFLGKDKTFSYFLYECSGNDLHLTTGFGNYKIDDNSVVLIDNYEKKWNVVVNKDNVEIELNGKVQTLTK